MSFPGNEGAGASMRYLIGLFAVAIWLTAGACKDSEFHACVEDILDKNDPIAKQRGDRFEGKVKEATARCRGGDKAVGSRSLPWLDWPNYYGTADKSSRSTSDLANLHGVGGALLDIERERVELIKFNLFDNHGTYREYVLGRQGVEGQALRTWPEMRLPPGHPNFADVGGTAEQVCSGSLIRFRTLTGICNDIRNPLMGSTGTLLARNVEFEETFPDAELSTLTRNRHGGRTSLMTPDPQVVSRRLFTRLQSDAAACADGAGKPDFAKDGHCDYKKAPFFNVIAAFWIQFMTHDWFSHLEEGHNAPETISSGCKSHKVNGVETPLSPADAARLGCRPGDTIDASFVADATTPSKFTHDGRDYLTRSPKTFRNTSTAWWDASQLYGYDERSQVRVKRDLQDSARLLMVQIAGRTSEGDRQGYLPVLSDADPKLPDWSGQEAAGFPDNWTIGLSFLHNVFAREHNQFVDGFRRQAAQTPDADSGLRNPADAKRVIRYRDVTPEELFQVARLVVSAEIAKIHTIEWTTQLLYNEPLFVGMNGNWQGVLDQDKTVIRDVFGHIIEGLRDSSRARNANELYQAFAGGVGIIGIGSKKNGWSLTNPDDVNGGVNQFGSPFNFPEEFISVYRLHPMLPDLIEYRETANPNQIRNQIPVGATFRGRATAFMRDRGLANWSLSFGRQRQGLLELENQPAFLQNLKMNRLSSATQQIDIAALDLIRDREHGIPKFNEFRRQYGLRQLTSFDDFIDKTSPRAAEQTRIATTMREVYGQHRCDASKPITGAQRNPDGSTINDCLDHPDGSMVDNIEDVDTVVGFLAEPRRAHGFGISETQFLVFILNASRRLFTDRFLTSSYRPEFYTTFGLDWVNNNGPMPMFEAEPINGHEHQPVSPLKRVLLRVMPELKTELDPVKNAFDPWARDRGEYYSLEWKPRKGAESDEAFQNK
jgi:hypothetical protein